MHYENRGVKIAGTGSYAPSKVVSNEEISKRVKTSPEWIFENLGIRERRVSAENEFTSDLAAAAGLKAIENAGLKRSDIDLVIVATATPDRRSPSAACMAQYKMKLDHDCPAFDLQAVCSGFIYALTVGSQFIQSGTYKNVLVIGADTFSKITDWERRDCVFFGDGAGAVVLQRAKTEDGLFATELFADGSGHDHFTIYPADRYFTMNGKAVYDTATKVLPKAIRAVLSKHDLGPSDITWIIPHQPSVRILQKTAEILEVPFGKVKTNMDRYANTSAATIPLLLDEVARSGQIKKDDLIVFAAVGSGWTWGAAVYKWQ